MPSTQICRKCGDQFSTETPVLLCPRCATKETGASDAPSTTGLETTTPLPPHSIISDYKSPKSFHPQLPMQFGDYTLLEEIARGGMGVVFKAKNLPLNRIVAVKMILGQRFSSAQAIQRFYTEARAVARLKHRHIIAIHEIGEHEGQHFFSMDFVPGKSLHQILHEGPLPPQRAAAYLRKLAEAVDYAHDNGVIHRDINPSNIMIDENDEPRLMDFGLAKVTQGEQEHTLQGTVAGTPSYMSPEQASGNVGEVTARSDIYSLGAVLYDVLCGKPPFRGATSVEILRQVIEDIPIAPRAMRREIPRDLETICLKCLEKQPVKRFKTAREMADELGRFLEGKPILSRRVGPLEKLGRWCRREPAAATALFFLFAGLAGTSWQWVRAERHLREAQNASVDALRREARLIRLQGSAGQRFDSQQALAKAAQIRRPPADMRNDVIASLTLADVAVGRSWEGNPEGTTALTMAPGVNLYARHDNNGIAVRTIDQDKIVANFPGGAHPATALLLSKNGRYLAAIHGSSGATVWDIAGNKAILRIAEETGPAAFDFSPDGSLFALGISSGQILLYDLPIGNPVPPLVLDDPASSVAFAPDGQHLAVSKVHSLNAAVFDLTTGAQIQMPHPDPVRHIAWHPSGTLLAAACADHQIYLWNLARSSRFRENANLEIIATDERMPLAGHSAAPTLLSFSHSGSYLASYGEEQTLRLWDVGSRRSLLRKEEVQCPALAFSPDDSQLACSLNGAKIELMEVAWADNCQTMPELHPGEHSAARLSLVGQGRTLALAASDGLHLWDLPSLAELEHVPLGQTYSAEAWPGHDDLVVRGDHGLHSFGVARETIQDQEALLLGPARAFDCDWGQGQIAVSTNAQTLFVAQDDQVNIYSTLTCSNTQTLAGSSGLQTLAVSPDGRWVAAANWKSARVMVWQMPAGNLVTNLAVAGRANLAFSPDGQWLGTSTEKELRLWRVGAWRSGVPLLRKRVGDKPYPLAFEPQGGMLAWGGPEGVIDLVVASNQVSIATFESPIRTPIASLLFTPDGGKLISAHNSFPVLVWDLVGIREALAKMQLDWSAAPILRKPAAVLAKTKPARIIVDLEPIKTTLKDFADIRRWEARVKEDPNYLEGWKRLGNTYLHLRQHEKALAAMDHALQIAADEQCLEWRADVLVFLGRYDEAIAAFQRCLTAFSKNFRSAHRLCYFYLQGPQKYRDLNLGAQYVKACQEIKPNDPFTLHRLGVLQYRQQQYAQAITNLTQAVAANKVSAPSFVLCQAMCYEKLGQRAQAMEAYRAAVNQLLDFPKYASDHEYYHAFLEEAEEVLGLKKPALK